jgi:hypothetical protein
VRLENLLTREDRMSLSAAEPKQVWLNRNMDARFAPPILTGGRPYGLVRVEFADGRLMWKEEPAEFGTVTAITNQAQSMLKHPS